MDPDIAAALYGGESDKGAPPVKTLPEVVVEPSALAKLGSMLSGKRADPMLDAERAQNPTMQSVDRGLNALGGGMSAHLDQRLPFGIGDAIRADREAAAKDEPGRMMALDIGGTLVSPIGIEGRAGRGAADIASRIGAAAASGGMHAAGRSVGDAKPDEDVATQAMRALAAGEKGAVLGGALGAGGEVLGAVARVARRFAMGGTSKDYGDIVKEQGTRSGIDYIQKELGNIPEQQGLTNLLWPQSKAGLAKRAATRAEEDVGPKVGESLVRAESEIPAGAINKQAVIGPLQREADALDNAARPGSRQFDQTIKQAAVAPFETPTDVAKLKRAYEAESYADGAIGGSRESRYATAQKAGADATRAHLSDVMDSADPVTAAQFHKASRDFADTKLVEGMAANASKYDFALPLGGAVAGGFIGHDVGHDARSTLEGAAAGALAGRYGADLTANLSRAGERATPALAKLGGALSSKMSTAGAQDVGGEARGHLIPQAIQDALRDNKLGPYSNEFAKAAMSPEPGALGVTFSRLSRDPQFDPYKRMLQEMTGGMQ
jgi:hypothetical protein